jgi:hypothetical protein
MIGDKTYCFIQVLIASIQIEDTDNANVLLRAEVLNRTRKNRWLLLPIRKRCLKK